MGQAEFDFWTAPERMSGPTEGGAKAVAANVKPLAEKTTFIGDGPRWLPRPRHRTAFGAHAGPSYLHRSDRPVKNW